jgi:hypothetical protein
MWSQLHSTNVSPSSRCSTEAWMVRLKLSDPPQAKPLPTQEQSAERPRNPTGVYAGKRFHCMCSCSNAARLVVRIPTADTCSVYRPGPDSSATVLWARASSCRARTVGSIDSVGSESAPCPWAPPVDDATAEGRLLSDGNAQTADVTLHLGPHRNRKLRRRRRT